MASFGSLWGRLLRRGRRCRCCGVCCCSPGIKIVSTLSFCLLLTLSLSHVVVMSGAGTPEVDDDSDVVVLVDCQRKIVSVWLMRIVSHVVVVSGSELLEELVVVVFVVLLEPNSVHLAVHNFWRTRDLRGRGCGHEHRATRRRHRRRRSRRICR